MNTYDTHPTSEEWTGEDRDRAYSEGWDLFDVCGSDGGRTQLQKIDEYAMFPDDGDAWVHVWTQAACGSAFHQKALDVVEKHNPPEWELIANHNDTTRKVA